MKLPLRKNHSDTAIGFWRESEPFVENRYGMLIHRPVSVTLFKNHPFHAHIAVGYWCGNHSTGKPDKFTFLAAPPDDKLVCYPCELRAITAGMKSSDELTGRHICIGRLKVINICHPKED